MSTHRSDHHIFLRYFAAATLLVVSCGIFLSIPYFFSSPEPEKVEATMDSHAPRAARKNLTSFRAWRL